MAAFRAGGKEWKHFTTPFTIVEGEHGVCAQVADLPGQERGQAGVR